MRNVTRAARLDAVMAWLSPARQLGTTTHDSICILKPIQGSHSRVTKRRAAQGESEN